VTARSASSPYVVTAPAAGHVLYRRGRQPLKSLSVELTERCNHDCIHCYINLPADSPAKARELPTAGVKRAMDEAAALGCLRVTFTGGEPLLRDDFEELYVHARRRGMAGAIRTNATLITPRLAGLFRRVPPLAPVVVTVYGMSEATYESVTRTPGSFAAFRGGVDLLLANGVPFEAGYMVTRQNMRELDEYEDWLAGLPGVKRPPSYDLLIEFRGRREPGKNAALKRLRLPPEDVVRIMRSKVYPQDEEVRAACSRPSRPVDGRLFACGACTGSCALDAYGYLQPCLLLRHPATVYDLKAGSMGEAMADFFPRVREDMVENHDYLTRCARCFLKRLCDQCPAWSWMEHGTLDTPVEYLCDVTHALARDAGLLREGEKAWEVRDGRERVTGRRSPG
jgi:radical SAM protein with 4Fe4S-binding SPASM domain